MNSLHYIGFDVHKKAISFCVKTAAGEIVEEGSVLAQREVLRQSGGTAMRCRHRMAVATN